MPPIEHKKLFSVKKVLQAHMVPDKNWVGCVTFESNMASSNSNHVSIEMWSLFVATLLIIYTALGKMLTH